MSEKSFDEILKEREAAIRQQWAAQSKAKKIANADDSSDGVIEGKRAMRALTDEDHERIFRIVCEVAGRNGVDGVELSGDAENPYSYFLEIPLAVDEQVAVKTCNELFHVLGLLPEGRNLALGELGDYCDIVSPEGNGCYLAVFNHPIMVGLDESDPKGEFILKNWRECEGDEEVDEEAFAMLELIDGIKAGRLKSKTPDGYLVLKGEFYDAIDSGRKAVEYRDFTEYNLKRTIGIKTIRFNRGYVKNAPQMKWEVEKVVLLDADDNECDPFSVPDGFWPFMVAIHLGKRVG